MYGLVAPHYLDLVLKFLTFNSSSCSFLPLIRNKYAFVDLLFPLFLYVHQTIIKSSLNIYHIKQSMGRNKAIGVLLASLSSGYGYAYYQVSEINKTLGNTILEKSIEQIKQKLMDDHQIINQERNVNYRLFNILNWFYISLYRLQVYFSRLLLHSTYKQTCQKVLNKVISPSIGNYQNEQTFQYSQIINQCKQQRQFNNKLANKLLHIQAKNTQLKNDNRLLLQRFYQLQQQLLTDHIYDLTLQDKQKVDVIYGYFREREKYFKQMIGNQDNGQGLLENERVQLQMNESNYGFKMQYL